MSHNAERLASFLERETMEYLRRHLALPEGAFFSVSRVVMDNALDKAQIFILIFPDKLVNETFREIRHLEKETRKYVASRLRRHKIPHIRFVLDHGHGKQVRLEKLLEDIREEEGENKEE